MSTDLVIERIGETLALAIVEDGGLADLWTADLSPGAIEDRLFIGRVSRVEPQVDGAFVEIGDEPAGFLAGKDARHRRGLPKRRGIRHAVEEGEWLALQGLREPVGDKGPRLTTDLRLLGPLLVYRPFGRDVQAAGGRSTLAREAAIERGRALLARSGLEGGLFLRRAADFADDATLDAELAALQRLHRQIEEAGRATGRKPGALRFGPTPLARLLWRAIDLAPVALHVADDALAAEARRLIGELPAAVRPAFERLPSGTKTFAATGVAEAITEAVGREIGLEGGGRLIVEETAACIAIDVDGGGGPALAANLEAAAAIGRLARLRNLGGTIIVDFVDLPQKHERQRVEQALGKAFRHDPLPVQILPMSPLGIVQISRARRGGDPLALFRRRCAACGGTGWLATGP